MSQAKEALLPRSDSMPCLSAQWEPYRDGILVRYRTGDGFVHRLWTKDRDRAHEQFLLYVTLLRHEVKHGKPKRIEVARDAWTAA